jgi:hypothetical protein
MIRDPEPKSPALIPDRPWMADDHLAVISACAGMTAEPGSFKANEKATS